MSTWLYILVCNSPHLCASLTSTFQPTSSPFIFAPGNTCALFQDYTYHQQSGRCSNHHHKSLDDQSTCRKCWLVLVIDDTWFGESDVPLITEPSSWSDIYQQGTGWIHSRMLQSEMSRFSRNRWQKNLATRLNCLGVSTVTVVSIKTWWFVYKISTVCHFSVLEPTCRHLTP